MYCTKCGADLSENTRFCTSCGADQNTSYTEPAAITESAEDQRPTTILVLGIIATTAVLTLMLVCLVLGSI